MMSKRPALILFFLILIFLCGCKVRDVDLENNPKSLKNDVKPPKSKKMLEPLVDSPLNDLEQEEFLKQYNKLPDSYIFEVSKKLSDSGKMSKKEMLEKIDMSFYDISEISLKGLRFLPNLEEIYADGAYIEDIHELSFLSIEIIIMKNCTFEESLDIVFRMLNRSTYVVLGGSNLKNLDFLKGIGKLNAEFNLYSNNITDISALADLEYQSINKLNLNSNEITDISVLKKFKDQKIGVRLNDNKITDISVFDEFTVPLEQIELSGNRIMDASPLQNVIDQNTALMIGDNCILDYSCIKNFMENHYYQNSYNPDIIPLNDYFRFDDPPSFKLKVNQKEISNSNFIYFDTEGAHWFMAVNTPIPACDAIMFIEELGGKAYYDINKGILSCILEGKNYTFKDFEIEVDCDGKKKTMNNPMKRMQGNIPYLSIEDMCKIFGLSISMKKGKSFEYVLNDGDLMKVKYIKEIDVVGFK